MTNLKLVFGAATKRAFDAFFATAALVVLAPVFAIIAALVKLDSRGPVFFRQERVGRHERPFWIHKFRTMVVGSHSRGLSITIRDDPRVTSVGRFLRRYKLDELPQLIDVIQGHMSVVGPRPELRRYVDLYPLEDRRVIFSVRPGITDLASLEFIDESAFFTNSTDAEAVYLRDILPRKIERYRRYAESRSFTGDLGIIARTLWSVLRPVP